MQEYVEERTIAISIKAAKLSGRALAAACKKVLAEMKKHHEAAKRPHGRQSVKKLMNHYGTKSAMKYVGAPKSNDIRQVLTELYEVFDFCAVEEAAHYYEHWQS